jgi:hypothetical protein
MRFMLIVALALTSSGCSSHHGALHPPAQAAAERLVDAFYSFDPDALRAALSHAPASQPKLLYYQGWAEGGNYAVVERKPCRPTARNEIRCDITVRDDLIAALQTGHWVTDTFHLAVEEGRIVEVRNSSNDPPDFDRALEWLKRTRPELMTGPCQGFFDGGPTPQECVRAVVSGFTAYRAAHPAGS